MCAIHFFSPYEETLLPSKATKEDLTFEQSMQALEKIVEEMEQGDLPLQDALEKFERGIKLAKHSQQTLEAAEQKVKILTSKNGNESLEDLPSTDDAI
jgi:exodeoxyribonuclease VII small subunit